MPVNSAVSSANNTPEATPSVNKAPVKTAAGLGMISCHYCGTLWKNVKAHDHCGRCNASLHLRKPDSVNRTWAYLIAACIMYIPANLLPVMITSTIAGDHPDTIMSGIVYFWVSGSWELAAIIFIASFLVPLFKLAALMLLLIMVQRRSNWRLLQRAKLYRLVEVTGRWSMLDVYVVALLAGLVQLKGFATIYAGMGIAAFALVVALTMFAAHSFDPRLTWDTNEHESRKSA